QRGRGIAFSRHVQTSNARRSPPAGFILGISLRASTAGQQCANFAMTGGASATGTANTRDMLDRVAAMQVNGLCDFASCDLEAMAQDRRVEGGFGRRGEQ